MLSDKEIVPHTFSAMASRITVHVEAGEPSIVQKAFCAVESETKRIEAKYSRYRPDNLVARINSVSSVEPTTIDPETAGLIAYCDKLFKESEGLFDITSGVLRQVWNFAEARIPSSEAIAAILPLIGWDKVQWDNAQVFLPIKGMQIDFGGVGKEYACDRAVEILKEYGINNALLNFGGDLFALGSHPSGRPWITGVCDPSDPTRIISTAATLHNQAMATSGAYQKCIVINGKRFSHLLNPHTGYPSSDLQSVTVIAPSCLVAGSLSTVAMLKNKPEALSFLDQSEVSYLVIDSVGQVQTGIAATDVWSSSKDGPHTADSYGNIS